VHTDIKFNEAVAAAQGLCGLIGLFGKVKQTGGMNINLLGLLRAQTLSALPYKINLIILILFI
jgi:hypothetical protein